MFEWLAPVASALAVVVAAATLAGWGLSTLRFARLMHLTRAVIMMPYTALALGMLGAALWLLRDVEAGAWRHATGRVLAAGATLLGVLTLSQYVLDVDLGIDLLLFGRAVESRIRDFPGRPSPMSALCFSLLGPALLLLHVRARRSLRPARWLVLAVLLLSTLALLGHVYREEYVVATERFGSVLSAFTPMPVASAVLCLLLSLGVLSVHPDSGLMAVLLRDDLGGLIARRLLPATLITPPLVGWIRLMGERLGLYGTPFGVSVFVVLTVAAFVVVILWNARALSLLDSRNRRVEQSLRMSEARFAGIVSNAADAIISVDGQQRITLFNLGAERIFGYSANEALGQPLDLLLPERLQALHRTHVQGFAAGATASRQMGERKPILGRRKNGEEFPAEASILKLEVAGARLLTVVLRDITARRRAEDVLRESEVRFRTAFEDAPIGMALVDSEGRFLHVNDALCQIVGYSQRELLSKTFQDITVPEDLDLDMSYVHRLLRGELSTYQLEKRYLHKGGHFVTVLLTASLVRDAQGAPLYFISQIQDITERKQLEQAWRFLAEAGPELAASLDTRTTLATVARLAVPTLADWCMVDLLGGDGRIQWVEIAAASPEVMLRLREMFAAYPHDPFRQGALTAGVLRTGEPVLIPELPASVLEASAVDATHLEMLRRLAPASGIIVPVRSQGRIVGAVILAASKSGRRYGPQELALAEELAHRAGLAIDNARLHEKSEQATRTRDEVLRIVAHDLRTPLNVISLSAGALMKGLPGASTLRKPVDSIQRSVQRANRLIQDLLDVARMEGGCLTLERARMEVAPLVRDAVELHRALAEARSIELTASVAEDTPPVFADRERVLQILSNLMGNSLKFTPEGGRVSVRVEAEGERVRFSVSDTGAGIPEEEQPHLFEPFWQSGVKRKEGAGLGLTIVKGLVDAHGGRVEVESRPGVGSCFSFTLPAVAPLETHAALPC
ncbi:PAS domain S-box protein [Pyxidicoccus sp. 3LG]